MLALKSAPRFVLALLAPSRAVLRRGVLGESNVEALSKCLNASLQRLSASSHSPHLFMRAHATNRDNNGVIVTPGCCQRTHSESEHDMTVYLVTSVLSGSNCQCNIQCSDPRTNAKLPPCAAYLVLSIVPREYGSSSPERPSLTGCLTTSRVTTC